jgi:glucose-6-phosphate isomerase
MATLSFSLDTTLLSSETNSSYGVTAETIAATAEHKQRAQKAVVIGLETQKYGFITTLDNPNILEEIRTILRGIEWADTIVVLGIGGSDLGARALQQALASTSSSYAVIFHGDSTDPVAITRLGATLELSKTVFVVISKSGETIETISQYVYWKAQAQEHSATQDQWQKHFIFITDAHAGVLRTEAEKHTIATLAIPATVGGRFSVQTCVGLLPAAALDIDIEAFLTGAREFVHSSEGQALALEFALSQFQLFTQGTKVAVLMPYSIQLEETARWFRQLWAESLGKNETGILPIQARGPADQHSQLQFYTSGSPLQSLIFIRIENRPDPITLPQTDVAGVEYLSGHTFHEIVNAEQRATALSLAKAGRPSVTISLQQLDAYSLGQLMLFFELSVAYLAELLSVNAFDQPGVEEGKQILHGLLKKGTS